ncbi:MAG: hypothetical protein FJY75_02225 [Candidatus Eisenbacteria bacterium]|uniref:Uncharacterized protein n=1 Tax=Eiseniibacteriota bacterium TaxID=2212470 RepID=A0A937X7K8_UNCEI|nr:hypothetical protein [Candidatus Eisenbacteria bacterium]
MLALFDKWKRYLLLPAALFVAVGLGTGCGDKDKGPGPDNGGGVDAQITFTLDGTQRTSDICLANYMVDEVLTSITSGDGMSWTLLFEFPGSGTGSFSTAGGATASLTLAPYWYEAETFTVTVSAYGGIGGAVKGTFSGTLVNIADDDDRKQVTNGTFTAERLPNVR